MSTSTESRSGLSGLLLAACALLVVVGLVLPHHADETSASYEPMSAPARPTKLIVPSLHLSATVKQIALGSDGVLDPPSDVRQVGWWQDSARPGASRGQTVLTGHTVHTGGGVMDDLGKLRKDTLVKVVTPRGTMVYRTVRTMTLTKAQISQRAQQLFGQHRDDDRLVLVTCTGWTGRDYTKNVVVFAQPLGVATSS